MSDKQLPDFYELLEISPNASAATVDRVFRYLAQRFHPDNTETGDVEKFTLIVKAHDTLRDPEKRAAYDIKHKTNSEYHWNLIEDAGEMDNFENDEIIQARVLSIMYMKRKRNIHNPGSGILELERLTGCPNEILDFHLWYLKGKGWVTRMENGLLAITADGVDKSLSDHRTIRTEKLLTDQRETIHL
jgi:curved DNA-binding protein CbpA